MVNEGDQCISVGANDKQVLEIPNICYRLSHLYAFANFLEAAMDKLESYREKCTHLSIEDYCKSQGIVPPIEHKKQPKMTEDEYFADNLSLLF